MTSLLSFALPDPGSYEWHPRRTQRTLRR
jgi:hypothetical protein